MKTCFHKYFLIALLLASFTFTAAFEKPGNEKGRAYFESLGEAVWEIPTDKKVIALTFDDGPDPQDTPQILDLLKKYKAKSTFFVIGSLVEKYPSIVQRQVREGHELANHSFSHPIFTKRISIGKMNQEIKETENSIFAVTGQVPSLFRPPGGYYDESIIHTSNKAGYLVVMWSWHQDTRDWTNPGVDNIVKKVVNNARNGDIVLFHDHISGRSQTIAALKRILPELQKKGFKCITVSEMLSYSKLESVKNFRKRTENK